MADLDDDTLEEDTQEDTGGDTQQMRNALAWVTDDQQKAKDPDTHVWTWLWEAIQGDFNEHRSKGQIAFDAAVSMIPLVNQVCCVRDFIADARKVKENPTNIWAWVAIVLTLFALFPSLGALLKGVLKIFFIFVRDHGGEVVAKAIAEGMTWVINYLRKPEVQKYIREAVKADEIFKWLADETRKAKGLVNTGEILRAFDNAISTLDGLVGKVSWIPKVGDRAKATMKMIEDVHKMADQYIGGVVAPIQKILDQIIEELERRAALERAAITDVRNVHFRGTLPEAEAVTLMREAEPLPAWLSKGDKGEWPELDTSDADVQAELAYGKANEYPDPGKLNRYNTIKAVELKGPKRLYRILSPTSQATSDCWMSEDVFKAIMESPDPRAAWRKYLAVWPNWNANGQFLVYDLKKGEKLKVWIGKTSSQTLTELPGVHLEGGWEQTIFLPAETVKGKNFADTMKYYKVDPSTGAMTEIQVANSKAFWALKSEDPQGYEAVRAEINQPSISGPFETNWGYTDFEGKGLGTKLGLPSLPGQQIKRADK